MEENRERPSETVIHPRFWADRCLRDPDKAASLPPSSLVDEVGATAPPSKNDFTHFNMGIRPPNRAWELPSTQSCRILSEDFHNTTADERRRFPRGHG